MGTSVRICQVAIPTPLARLFDYRIPANSVIPAVGARVRVPFGRRANVVGVVMGHAGTSEIPEARLRPISQVLDVEPLFPPAVLDLLTWASGYYHHALGEVLHTALPVRLRQGHAAEIAGQIIWALTAEGAAIDIESKRAPVQRRLLAALRSAPGGLNGEALAQHTPRWAAAIKSLQAKGWAAATRRDCPEPPGNRQLRPAHALNAAQQAVFQAIDGASGFQAFLLHGVTGSGKTEVYLQAVARVIDAGRAALVLVPEIGLTPQLVARFHERFALPLAVLHSGLNDVERAGAWLMARAGKARIVLGTRSAVFTPLPRLGLIVVDEEHDASYKQQDGFRYSARDVAIMRAHRDDVPIVLGSATPSLESIHHARTGMYRGLELVERAGSARLPEVQLLDMRRLTAEDGVSQPLRVALAQCLERGEQSLLFLNRRGFSPVWMCHDCGWVAPCVRCDARLTFHRSSARLRCHHCGAESKLPLACPTCQGTRLHPLGEGTERVEAALGRLYPGARVVRIDRDTTRRKGALEESFKRVHAGEADILVGTQMLSKGHDFPGVTLVGVLNADQGLYSADFRAGERLFQQIVQVSGRAGRAERPGRVLIQTYHPDHPLFAALVQQDYQRFADYALAERREADYPPFQYLALLRAESTSPTTALAFLHTARRLAQAARPDEVTVLEPVASPMERRAGRYRAQLLVQSPKRGPLHTFLDRWLPRLSQAKQGRKVRWSLDVDPLDLY